MHRSASAPDDRACYDTEQLGCKEQAIEDLPAGLSVLFTECSAGSEGCSLGVRHSVNFEDTGCGQVLCHLRP